MPEYIWPFIFISFAILFPSFIKFHSALLFAIRSTQVKQTAATEVTAAETIRPVSPAQIYTHSSVKPPQSIREI